MLRFVRTKVFCCKIFERLRDALNRQPTEIQMKPKFKQLQILAGKKCFGAKIGNCLNAITTAMMSSPFDLYSRSLDQLRFTSHSCDG